MVGGDTVTSNVGYYCATPCVRIIHALPEATIREMTRVNQERNRAGANVRDHRRRPPGGE